MNYNNCRISKFTIFFLFLIIIVALYLFSYKANYSINEDIDLKRLLIGGIEAAVNGGLKVKNIYISQKLNIKSKGLTKEGSENYVTEADLQSHCAMYYGLSSTFPHLKIISEEQIHKEDCWSLSHLDLDPNVLHTSYDVTEKLVKASDVTVWIDPLDATQEYTEKLVQYVTTMVCVAIKGVPTIGIIHFPFTSRTIWAWVGRHVPLNSNSKTETVKVITSRSHKGSVTSLVKKALGDQVVLIHAGGAGYKSLEVASGNVSAYVHTTHIKKWDTCAGDAILRALGGTMTTLLGQEIYYGSDSSVVNPDGLIAALSGHSNLVQKFLQAGR